MLGDILDVEPGDMLQVEVLEGRRPVHDVPVAALVDDSLGLQAYMRIDAVQRMLREGPTLSGAALTLDPARGRSLLCDGQAAAGGGRRGNARRRPPELS